MAYSLETSSVKTIVPGAEVSGFCDVVARQKINEVSGEVPQLSAGEGIDISTVDGKTVITNNISAGQNISLVYDMETNTYRIDSNAGGGDVVSPYGTLITNGNSAEASISGLIPEHIGSAETVSSDVAFWITSTPDAHNTITINSANTVTFIANEYQYTSGIVDLSVYENDAVATSLQGTAFNFTTSYSEPTNVRLVLSPVDNGAGLTASTISSNYAIVVPDEIVNLYEPSPATQSAIDIKSQIGVIMGSYTTAESYNPAKDAKLIVSGEKSYAERGRKVIVEFDKNGTISSLDAGYLVPRGGNGIHGQVLSNYYDRPHWVSIASITSGAGSAQINYLSGAIDYVSSNAGLYTGVAPIQVNNTTDEISITGESLSAGPGIDMFSSGGYVVVSSTGKELSAGPGIDLFESGGYFVISGNGGNTFPITGTNGTTGFTANMDCSSMMLTTGASPAGGYVKQTVRGVQYEAYPATDVSASWYNIINATNNRSNCYCIRFTNDMTAASLEDYSAYDKVTVVHSNEYTPDCMLYWDGNTKVFPSGLYCELVKGVNDQNQTDWFFTTSGWINNVEWDWD